MKLYKAFLEATASFIASEAGHICLLAVFTIIGLYITCQRGDTSTLAMFGAALLVTLKGTKNTNT